MGLVMALSIAELHKAQRPRAGVAVGGQGGQAQQLEMFDGQLGPGQGGAFLGLFGRLYGGGGGCHQGLSSSACRLQEGALRAPFATQGRSYRGSRIAETTRNAVGAALCREGPRSGPNFRRYPPYRQKRPGPEPISLTPKANAE
ncbi:protein of unknown function [Pseudomonas sp. JV551A1]|uniref:Uncharacterized protein n=1 Tax=Pseudomonas inefficax TaxID=2078786 RepID=A0AAQ1SSV2_9PSED|nr:protein of unknown function [Pseudomonas sp. JV551A1]SPO60222.1 protein of unknown function [Pseudomonas inefficax]